MGALKGVGARLALVGILALHLHVLAHVFGYERKESAKEAPCPICLAVLGQRSLPAVTTVEAPAVPIGPADALAERIQPGVLIRSQGQDSRGPPPTTPALKN
jgi:hypothetical protein